MNDKTIRYIGIGIGFLITLAILYVNNDGSFSEYGFFASDSEYGFFASDIKHTMIYDLLKALIRCIKNKIKHICF
jgi:hypothetical protein